MRELMIDFITSLDGYASGEGWPGWWGLEGPEYLAWLGEQPPVTYLMGANITDPGDIAEAYVREHGPVALPDLLGAIATLIAKGALVYA